MYKKHKRFLCFITVLVMTTGVMSMSAQRYDTEHITEDVVPLSTTDCSCCGNFRYTLSNANEATITSFIGDTNNVTIGTVDGFPVVAIGASAFVGSSVSGVTLPNTVRTIGEAAFRNVISLRSITLNEGLTTINRGAFYNTRIEHLVIPDSVTTIHSDGSANSLSTMHNRRTFGANPTLHTVEIGNGLTDIQVGTFFGATALENIIFGENVEIIHTDAFNNNTSLRTLNLSDNITTIRGNAFYNATSLSTINFGNNSNLHTIEASAFFGNSLNNIVFPNSLRIIGEHAFQNNTTLRNITLNEGLTTIRRGAFHNTRIEHLVIPDSVTAIHSEGSASSLSTTHNRRTFGANPALHTVEIGNGLTDIQVGTFFGATALENLIFGENVEIIHADAFNNSTSLKTLNLNENITAIRGGAFYNATSLSTINFGNNNVLYAIEANAFFGNSLNNIVFPNSLRIIGDHAFQNNITLRNVTLNEGLTNIGRGAFNNTRIEHLVIPDSVVIINSENSNSNRRTFGANPALHTVIIGNGLTTIQPGTFHGASALDFVRIGANVHTIGVSAFQNAGSLQTACFMGDAPEMGNNVFAGVHSNFTIHHQTNGLRWTNPWSGFSTQICNCVMSIDTSELAKLIEFAESLIRSTHNSTDGAGISTNDYWAIPLEHSRFQTAIDNANIALERLNNVK